MAGIDDLGRQALADIAAADSPEALEALRVALLGKQGSVTAQLKSLGALPADQRKSAILYALYLAQAQGGGYLTAAAMRHVAEQIRCTPAEVEDVVSYYTMFYTKPVGTYVLNVCRTLSCALLGAERVTEELSSALGIRPGETDPSGTFTLIEVECLGACDRAPIVMVNDDWHERLAPEQAGPFVDDIKARGRAAFTGCHLHKEK